MNHTRDRRVPRALSRAGLCAALTSFLFACSSTSSGPNGGMAGSGGSSTGSGGGSTDGGPPDAFESVCGFQSPVTLGAPAADGFVDVPFNHPDILYFGRVDCTSAPAPSFAYPGVSIRARFKGDGIDLRLKDHGTPATINYYDVIFDGAAPTVLEVSPSQEVYPIGRNLGAGEHTVEIFKRIESAPSGTPNAGKGEFLGFRVPEGSTLLPLSPRPHRIEFIGDSITCGYGDEVSVVDPSNSHYTTKGSNANKAWGAVAARALDAEYMAVAYSGRGVYRNFMGGGGDTLPQMYGKSLPDDPAAAPWDFAAWTPDVVVVNLGTNDFSMVGTDEAAYRTAYVDFLAALRGHYAAATFIIAAGPMISDFYPAGEMAWTKIQADLKQIAEARKAAGDADVHVLILPPQSPPYGEDYHPTAATQQAMADQVVALVKQQKGW